jgi:hypothetical protein
VGGPSAAGAVPATKSDLYAAGIDWQDIAEIESGGVEDARINPRVSQF